MFLMLEEIWWQLLLICVVSYFIGNINFALIISKFKKSDVRRLGSGNPGTLNMSRNFGIKIGVLVLLLDMLKGGLPALTCYLLYNNQYLVGTNFEISDLTKYLAGLFVIIGHIYPIFLKFKGGKGIASTLGVFLFTQPITAVFILPLTAFYMYKSEWGSMASLLGVTGFAIIQAILFLLKYNHIVNMYLSITLGILLFICFLTWFAHRKNIVRLLSGEEHHTSIKKMLKNKKNT